MDKLHQDHPEVVRMKAVARSYVWWSGVDTVIEAVVKECQACQTVRNVYTRVGQYTSMAVNKMILQ